MFLCSCATSKAFYLQNKRVEAAAEEKSTTVTDTFEPFSYMEYGNVAASSIYLSNSLLSIRYRCLLCKCSSQRMIHNLGVIFSIRCKRWHLWSSVVTFKIADKTLRKNTISRRQADWGSLRGIFFNEMKPLILTLNISITDWYRQSSCCCAKLTLFLLLSHSDL